MKLKFVILYCVQALLLIRPAAALPEPPAPEYLDSLTRLTYADLTANLYESKLVLEQALPWVDTIGQPATAAYIHQKLGAVNHLLNKPEASFVHSNLAVHFFGKAGMPGAQGNMYANIGHFLKARDLERAAHYMQKGIRIMEEYGYPELAAAYDNYGVLKDRQGQSDSALFYFRRSLALKQEQGDRPGIPFSLQKIAVVSARKGETAYALETMREAMAAGQQLGDSLIIGESYAYFGDIYLAAGNYAESAENFERALGIAGRQKLDYLVKYIYGTLPGVYASMGRYDQAYDYQRRGSELKDSLFNSEHARSIAELETAFETSQKEQKIQLLEQEVLITGIRLKQNRRILAAGLAIAGLLFLLVYLLRNREQLRHESELARQQADARKAQMSAVIQGEEKERERVARELHDGLGQVLAASRMRLSVLEDDVQDDLRPMLAASGELIDQACTEVREISHALMPGKVRQQGLEAALHDLVRSVNASGAKTMTLDTTPGAVGASDDYRAVAVYRIVQELVHNSLKHSDGNRLELRFHRQGDKTRLDYADHGQGFDAAQLGRGDGIGWNNIRSRVDMLDGELEVSAESGLRVSVSY